MKRILDIIFASLLFPILILSYIVLAPIIKLSSKGPIIYKQKRLGKYKREFIIYKFRSMYLNNDLSYELKDDPRVTPIGKIIRKMKIDELPQLVNVFKGDMSVVGPRPYNLISCKEIEGYFFSDYRYYVRPGLTCLSYVMIDDDEYTREELMLNRAVADNRYVCEKSFLLDFHIIKETVKVIIKRAVS